MALLETVSMTIGGAIAKHLLESWFGDKWQTKVAKELVDLVAKSLGEQKAQRSERDILDDIAKQIVTDIKPLFEKEIAGLDEGERYVALTEAATTLAQTHINASVLIDYRLDDEALIRYLQNQRKEATQTLSEKATSVYRLVLVNTGRAILNFATQLVGFERLLAKNLLSGQDRILTKLLEAQQHQDDNNRRFTEKYAQNIAEELNKLDLFGIHRNRGGDIIEQQELSVAYIELNVEETSREDKQSEEAELRKLMGTEWRGKELEQRHQLGMRSGPAAKLLNKIRRAVIRGAAGSGKSTLLQWLAIYTAKSELPPELESWKGSIPFFIRLRQYVDKPLPKPEEFPMPYAGNWASIKPADWTFRILDSTRALVLVDGLDEMPAEQRPVALKWLNDLVRDFPYARFIVSSRPSAITEHEFPSWQQWTEEQDFAAIAMRDMTLPQIEEFVEHWYAALIKLESRERNPKNFNGYAEDLKRQMRNRRELQRLATNPLLCSMISLLHSGNPQNVPTKRLRLYRVSIELLLFGRDRHREIDLDNPVNKLVDEEQKEYLLCDLAYHMMRNRLADWEINNVDQRFDNLLERMRISELSGTQVRKFFVERTSLLRESVGNRIEFTHKSFLEYLAANAAHDAGDYDDLVQRSEQDSWWDTIVLFAGLLKDHEWTKFVPKLLEKAHEIKGKGSAQRRNAIVLLAVACLENRPAPDATVRNGIMLRAKRALPPKNDAEVDLVARASDPIIELLTPNRRYSEENTLRCVTTLVKIGSNSAMEMLANYANDERSSSYELQIAIGNAWLEFDRERYAKIVLTHSKTLRMSKFVDWQGIEFLSHLQHIDLDNTQVSDLEPLKGLSQLQSLYLDSTQVSDLEPLKELSELRTLSLTSTQIKDLPRLKELSELLTLYLDSTQVSDLEPLKDLSHLQSLYLNSTQVSDLEPLKGLSHLQLLNLNSTQVSDLKPLKGLSHLQWLQLNSTRVSDLEPLKDLSQLQRLCLNSTRVSDLEPLKDLSRLYELELNSTQVSNLGPLDRMINLRVLVVDSAQPNFLAPLKHLENLQIIPF